MGKIVKADLEWRFHGPPSCQHLMRILTGHIECYFTFSPLSITALGHNLVVAEGRGDESGYWVHVWTVEEASCMVTQLREYFNTSVIVSEFKAAPPTVVQKKKACSQSPLWQSNIGKSKQNLMPGLVLAIWVTRQLHKATLIYFSYFGLYRGCFYIGCFHWLRHVSMGFWLLQRVSVYIHISMGLISYDSVASMDKKVLHFIFS